MIKKIIAPAFIIISLALPCAAENYQEMGEIIRSILDDTVSEESHQKSQTAGKIKNGAPKTEEDRNKKEKKTKTVTMSMPDEVLFSTGIQLYNSGAYDQSLTRFSNLLKQYPSSPYTDSARIYISKNLLRKYRYSDAIETLSKVSEKSGVYPAALYETGEASIMKGERLAAVDYFQKIAALFPGHELADNALLRSASIFLYLEKGHQAAEASIRIIKEYSKNDTVDDAYFLLARIFETDPELKDMERAAEFYRLFLKKAAKGDPLFSDSPLKDRVKRNLDAIEKNHLRLK